MPVYIDLDIINEIISVEEDDRQYELSPASHAIAMCMLAHAADRWHWHKSGVALNDEEWDEVEAMVSLAIEQLTVEI